MTFSAAWQGPIPPAAELQVYEDIQPGLADRIMKMAEQTVRNVETQTQHRLAIERRMVSGQNTRANIGLWLAFVLALAVLGGSFYVIVAGHDAAGASIAGIDLVGLCSVFVYGRYDQYRREKETTE